MFSAYLSRIINHPTHSYRFLPFILRSIAAQHASSYSHSAYTFSHAFRRTLGMQTPKLIYTHFSTLNPPHIHNPYETINFTQLESCTNESKTSSVIELVKLLRSNFGSEDVELMDFLDGSGIKASRDLVISVIWALRDEWKLAFFVFKWGQKWRCDDEKAWSLIIWVLGNHKKFNNAWCLIRDLYRSSMDTHRPMFVLIDRYAAMNEPREAIRAFQIMEKFKLSPDQKAFYTLLYTLCKHGNVEEAEEFMFLNTKLFPLETEGFNVILGGWCDIFVDIFEAKRVWKEMDKRQVIPDETSYTHMISCFSKVNNLFDSLRLYDEMTKKGWKPNRKIYNSLVYILARENCHNEALGILRKMTEVNLRPDSTTYNLVIRPLCESGKLEDAKSMLSRMLEENVNPNTDTYHAFLEGMGVNFGESLELLERMAGSGIGPNKDTFLILVGKFLKLDEVENALKIWVKMKEYKVSPDLAHFVTMVEGLVKHGLIGKAKEVYGEMISIGIPEDPKLKKMLKELSEEDERGKTKKRGMRNARYGDRGGWGRGAKKWVRGK
ncbi:hypothetical protein OSB04_004186 [Centaurea solstitialis]|uniref:Pentatricopeptide repeat-containing protein n=1 Tax=Centaurea solstitialis TaxID=347529 RepID=A0AA38WU62_9ASTR|nr:hypothetical protein OSB04_004186 [Centaurea solstitialis]